MRQISLSATQWAKLLSILCRVRSCNYNEWYEWIESDEGIISAGMDAESFRRAAEIYWKKYKEVDDLVIFLNTNVRLVEEEKA